LNYNINLGKDFGNQFLEKLAHIYELEARRQRRLQMGSFFFDKQNEDN